MDGRDKVSGVSEVSEVSECWAGECHRPAAPDSHYCEYHRPPITTSQSVRSQRSEQPVVRSGWWQGWRNEPARIVAWAAAALQAVVAFGVLDLSNDQQQLILTLIAMTVGAGEVTRANVTPTRKLQ